MTLEWIGDERDREESNEDLGETRREVGENERAREGGRGTEVSEVGDVASGSGCARTERCN